MHRALAHTEIPCDLSLRAKFLYARESVLNVFPVFHLIHHFHLQQAKFSHLNEV